MTCTDAEHAMQMAKSMLVDSYAWPFRIFEETGRTIATDEEILVSLMEETPSPENYFGAAMKVN